MTGSQSDLERMTALVRAHRSLSRATTSAEIVAALADACEPYGPATIALFFIHDRRDGQPERAELVGVGGPGLQRPADQIVGQSVSLTESPLLRAALAEPTAPHVAASVATGEALGAAAALLGSAGAVVLLPLHSARHGKWQGLAVLGWREPREPGAGERLEYELLQSTLSESIAIERTLQAYRQSLVENERLLAHAQQALQESQRSSTMLRTLLDHLPLGVSVVRIVEGGKIEVVMSAGKFDPRGLWGGTIDLMNVVAYGPGEDEPLAMERMPAFVALQTGQTARGELEIPMPNGSRALLDATATPMRYEGDPSLYLVTLYSDVTEARQAERERLATQEKLLQVQALALAERSTPLIPIREDVLVLPLVGSIDEERGRQILETLVNLGGRTNVRAAIIDVTGVRNLDTSAARVLLDAAQALRLRGVKSILTGIQASAAMTLVGLGVDFSGIAVQGVLQDGVALATQR